MKNCCPRLLRLLEQLSGYVFKIQHVAGMDNYASDMMSRLTRYTDPEFYQKLTESVGQEYVPPGFEEVELKGRADSAFLTISMCLNHLRLDCVEPNALRHTLIREIINNPVKYKVQGKPEDMKSLKAMLNPGVAVYVIVFQAAAEIYKVRFNLYFGIEQPLVFEPKKSPKEGEDYPDAFVMCRCQGNHFNPLLCMSRIKENQHAENLKKTINTQEFFSASENSVMEYELEDEDLMNDLPEDVNLETLSVVLNSKPQKNVVFTQESGLQCAGNIAEPANVIHLRKKRSSSLCFENHRIGDCGMRLTTPDFEKISQEGEFKEEKERNEQIQKRVQYFCVALDSGSSISVASKTTYQLLKLAGFV